MGNSFVIFQNSIRICTYFLWADFVGINSPRIIHVDPKKGTFKLQLLTKYVQTIGMEPLTKQRMSGSFYHNL